MRTLIKVLGTALVVVLLTYPLWAPQWGSGILGEIWAFGVPGSLAAIIVFFSLVALYCRSLQRTLSSVRTEARMASPRSVWLMFAIPYNFVEDFFIVSNVGRSLSADGSVTPRFARVWLVLGFGWAALQIVSLLPGEPGLVGGALALVAWGSHWILTARANRILRTTR